MSATPDLRLVHLLPETRGHALADTRIGDLVLDSRAVAAGDVFVAIKGEARHGMEYAAQARSNGAAVILSDEQFSVDADDVLLIEGLRDRLPEIACKRYGDPSLNMSVIGVTGTNGKTTTAQLLAQVLSSCQQCCGVIGTLGWGMPGALEPSTHTTADVISNQRMLAALRDAGASAVTMEVSSHALQQDRVAGVRFNTAVFTNLSRDHLDYHGSYEAYGNAKARLLSSIGLEHAVLNRDDLFCQSLGSRVPANVSTTWYSVNNADADVRAQSVRFGLDGIQAFVETPWGAGELHLPLIGGFNLPNALAVLSAACLQGIAFDAALAVLAAVKPVPGRMERVATDAGAPLIIIDYAHTPDALDQALSAVREHVLGRVWCVFGCGGDRDSGKRPLMGRLAHERSDVVIVTSDNPRSENPLSIIADICAGIPTGDEQRIVDRAEAIDYAVRSAKAGDAVLIAGKGHEDYQEINGQRLPFSDLECVRTALLRRGAAA